MSRTPNDLTTAALDLPLEDREALVEALLASLAEERLVERAWMAEAQRRYQRIREGATELIDNDEVFARLRARYG